MQVIIKCMKINVTLSLIANEWNISCIYHQHQCKLMTLHSPFQHNWTFYGPHSCNGSESLWHDNITVAARVEKSSSRTLEHDSQYRSINSHFVSILSSKSMTKIRHFKLKITKRYNLEVYGGQTVTVSPFCLIAS